MPFYQKTSEELITAPNFVSGPGFDLDAELKDTYEYPVNDWYWFDTLDEALEFFRPKSNAVTMRQARLALHQQGLLANVDAAIDSLPEPMRTKAKIEWEYSQEVQRGTQTLGLITLALGLTEQQVDDLFALAETLKA